LRLVDPGNYVTSGSTTGIAVVTTMSPTTVIFSVAQSDLAPVLVQVGQGASLDATAYASDDTTKLENGALTAVDNQVDTATGMVKLRATFANADGALFPNEFVNTRLLVNTLENQTIVPSSAIQHNGTQDFVYLLQGLDPKNLKSTGKAVMKTVKSGVSDGGNTAVTGISPGNMVANSSFQKLVDGSPVIQSQVKIPATSTDTTEEAP